MSRGGEDVPGAVPLVVGGDAASVVPLDRSPLTNRDVFRSCVALTEGKLVGVASLLDLGVASFAGTGQRLTVSTCLPANDGTFENCVEFLFFPVVSSRQGPA